MPSIQGKESVRLPSTDEDGVSSASPTASTTTMITAAASTASTSMTTDALSAAEKQKARQQGPHGGKGDNKIRVSETQQVLLMHGMAPTEAEPPSNGDHPAARQQEAKPPVRSPFLIVEDASKCRIC